MPVVNYDWDELEDNIVEEYDDAGATIADYTTEPDHFGNVISQYRDRQSSFFHYDGLGSTLAVTDESQNVTDTFAYSAFGELTERTGTSLIPFQYIGKKGYYTDGLMGQILVRRRPYEPVRARWLSVDPVMTDDSPYVYAANQPTAFVDPSGLFPGGGHGFYTTADPPPRSTGECGGAEARGYWLFSERRPGLNGWVIQFARWQYDVFNCDDTPRQMEYVIFLEAWQVRDGVVYDGFRNAAGDNSHPPFVDWLAISDRGDDSKGTIKIFASAYFVKDYELRTPPWARPGEPGHEGRGGTLPTVRPPPFPVGFRLGDAIERTLQSTWDCCSCPRKKTDIAGSEGW